MSPRLGIGLGTDKVSGALQNVLAPNEIASNQLWLDASDTAYLNAKGSASFVGSNIEYLSSSNSAFDFTTTSPHSWQGWVYLNLVGANQCIAGHRGSVGEGFLFIVVAANTVDLLFQGSSNAADRIRISTTAALSVSTWYHLAFTYDGSKTAAGLKIFINGQLADFTVVNDALTGSSYGTGSYALGEQPLFTSVPLTARIDQASVYSSVLTPDDIMSLYNSGNGRDYAGAIAQTSISAVAANFTASSSEYLSTSDSVFNVGDEDFAFGGWFLVPSAAGNQQLVSKSLSTGNQRSYRAVRNSSGFIEFRLSDDGTSGGETIFATTFTETDAQWFFAVFVYDSVADLMKVTVDGATFQTTSHANGGFASSTAELTFAAINVGGTPTYSDLKSQQQFFYKKALSQAECDALYNSGSGVSYGDLSAAQKTSLTAWWSMQEASGIRADSHKSYYLTDNNTVTSTTGIVTPSVDLTSPTAWWEMDEISGNRADSSGNGYTLTDNNTVGFALGKVTSTINNNDGVWRWVDKSSNGYVFQQDTAASQPQFALNYLASKNYIVFDGIDDFLQYQTGAWRSGDNLGTFVFILEHNVGNFSFPFSGGDSASPNDYNYISFRNTNIATIGNVQAAVADFVNGTTTLTAQSYIFMAQSNGSSWAARLNGADESLVVAGGSNNGEWLNDIIGYNRALIGAVADSTPIYGAARISEIIYFNRVLTADEISGLEKYLAKKHSITLS